MQRTTPPFRADHVGSLLRCRELKDARARRERGELTARIERERAASIPGPKSVTSVTTFFSLPCVPNRRARS